MIVLAVTWAAKPGCDAEVAELFRKLEAESRQEPGCLMYVVHRHRADSRHFFIYEQYHDEESLDAHRNSPHFQALAVGRLPSLADRIQGDLFDPLT